MDHDNVVEDLLNQYAYQKERLMEQAGCPGVLRLDRLRVTARPRMEKLAHLIHNWDVTPELIMAAAFALAKKEKHPDGPMPNVLCSEKYLTRALSEFLQVPFAAVAQKRSLRVFLERKDFDFEQCCKELDAAGVTDLVTATVYPLEYRCLLAAMRLQKTALHFLTPEVLERMRNDRRVSMWLEHRGVKYVTLANSFNKNKNKQHEK